MQAKQQHPGRGAQSIHTYTKKEEDASPALLKQASMPAGKINEGANCYRIAVVRILEG